MNRSAMSLRPGRLLLCLAGAWAIALSPSFAAEAPPTVETPPPSTVGAASAEQALSEYDAERRLLLQGREAAAEYHYDQGRAAMLAGDLPKALRELQLAVDYAPGNQDYRGALRQAEVFSGTSNSPYETTIGDMQSRIDAMHQELWVDIERQLELGKGHVQRGEYYQAEQAFETARVRLENLPYADPRKEPKLREVEKLLAENDQRRRDQELSDAVTTISDAEERQRQRRAYELRIEEEQINQMLARALKARDRRDYDEAILLAEQVLRINRADPRAHELLAAARRERHIYLRQITADKWDEEHRLLSQNIREALLPQLDLIVYSEEWDEIDARRQAPSQALTTESANEAWKNDIEQKLDQKLTLNFPELTIEEVVNFLRHNTDVNFVLDPRVASDDIAPINMTLRDVQLRNALEFIMLNTGLKYSLQGEAVYVSNEEGQRGDIYTRVYDIRDLTLGLTQFPGPRIEIPEPGGEGARLVPEIRDNEAAELDDFIEIIEEIIPAQYWEVAGTGLNEWNGSLVVTQTTAVHDQIAELLRTLRNQQAVQINVKVRFLSVENSLLEEIGFDWNRFTGPPGWPAPVAAGGDPELGGVTPPYWLGGYWADSPTRPRNIAAGQITNNLPGDYQGDSGLDSTGGLSTELQIFEDPEGFLGRVFLRAVEKDRRTNVLIAPNLTMMSGQRAHIVRMNQQAYVADFDVVGEQYDPVVTVLSYGTVLDVEAVASSDRRNITLTLRPSTSEVVSWRRFGTDVGTFGGVNVTNTDSNGNNLGAIANNFPIFIPELSYRQVQTSVTIPDGGSMMIAGMTEARSARTHAGIPVLSHIPFIGRLFSKNGRVESERKDLVYVEGNIVLFDEIEANL